MTIISQFPAKVFILITITCSALRGFALPDSLSSFENSIYLEVLGSGGYGSLNYERQILNRRNLKMFTHLGYGGYTIFDYRGVLNPDIIIPFGIHAIFGNNHFLEAGMGQAFSTIIQANSENGLPDRLNSVSANFTFGYRYQKKTSRIVFRCVYTSIFEHYQRFLHWGGLSIGYRF